MSKKLTYLIGFVCICLITGCSSQVSTSGAQQSSAPLGSRIDGESEKILGNEIKTWEVLESGDTGRVAGLTLPLNLITEAGTAPDGPTSLEMPSDVKTSTFVDHVDIQYEPSGMGSDLKTPIFAFRFYGIDKAEQSLIDCSDKTPINADRITDGYTDPSRPGSCVDKVGQRSVAKEISEDPDHPTPFAHVNFGYYKGRIIFVEILVTAEKLLEKDSFTVNLPLPNAIGSDALIPSTFTGVYKGKTDSFDLAVWAFANPDSAQNSS